MVKLYEFFLFIIDLSDKEAHADYNASLNIKEKGYRQSAERRSA
jgi:hypothetical protein